MQLDVAAGGDGVGVALEEVGVGAQVLGVDGGVVVDIDEEVAEGVGDAAVAGVGEALAGFDEVAEGDVGVVGLEALAFGLGVVGAVVVDQHNLIVAVRIVVVGNALQHIVDIFVAVVCAEYYG